MCFSFSSASESHREGWLHCKARTLRFGRLVVYSLSVSSLYHSFPLSHLLKTVISHLFKYRSISRRAWRTRMETLSEGSLFITRSTCREMLHQRSLLIGTLMRAWQEVLPRRPIPLSVRWACMCSGPTVLVKATKRRFLKCLRALWLDLLISLCSMSSHPGRTLPDSQGQGDGKPATPSSQTEKNHSDPTATRHVPHVPTDAH